jgi:lysophospholipase L1-like esterase
MSTFVNPYTIPAANIASSYANAIGAASNGQYFGYWDNGGDVLHVYLKGTAGAEAGKGIYQGTIPWGAASSTPSQTFQDAVETARVTSAMSINATNLLLDMCSVDGYYDTTRIKNRALEASLSNTNVLGITRPWKIKYTVTGLDATYPQVAAGPDGTSGAVSIKSTTAPGTGQYYFSGFIHPAGLWTMAVDVRNMDLGNATTIKIGHGSLSANKAVAAGDGAFHTFTTLLDKAQDATGALFVCAGDGATAFDLIVDNVRIVPGDQTGTLGVQNPPLVEHPFAGAFVSNAASMRRSGKVITNANSAGNRGTIYWPLPYQLAARTAMSVCMALKRSAATANPNAFAADVNTDTSFTTNFSVGIVATNTKTFSAGGMNTAKAPSGTIDIKQGDEYVVVSGINGPSGSKIFIDNIALKNTVFDQSNPAFTGTTMKALEILTERSTAAEGFEGSIASMVVYDRELSVSDMQSVIAATKGRISALGLTHQTFNNVYIAEGDSISEGAGASVAYVGLVGPLFMPRLNASNLSKTNSNLRANGTAYLNLDDQTTPIRKNNILAVIADVLAGGRRPIVSVFIGANDSNQYSGAGTPAAYYAQLQSYWAALRSAGAKVIACTVLPQRLVSQGGTYTDTQNTNRGTLNGLIRGAVGVSADAVCDFDSGVMNTWSATYWGADSVHPNQAGHDVMAPLMQTAISGLLLLMDDISGLPQRPLGARTYYIFRRHRDRRGSAIRYPQHRQSWG